MLIWSQDTDTDGGDSFVSLNTNQMTLEVMYSEQYNCAVFKSIDFEHGQPGFVF